MEIKATNENNLSIVFANEKAYSDKTVFARLLVDNNNKYYDTVVRCNKINNSVVFDFSGLQNVMTANRIYTFELLNCKKQDIVSVQCPKDGVIMLALYDVAIVTDIFAEKLQMQVKLLPKYHAELLSIENQNGYYKLYIKSSQPIEDPMMIVSRRTTLAREYIYDRAIKFPIHGENNTYIVFLEQRNFLSNQCQEQKEIWDVSLGTSKFQNIFASIKVDIELNDQYHYDSDGIDIKFYISESMLSIFTKYNSWPAQRKIKVAILGSCYTKEVFHSLDFTNIDYKRFYSNDLVGFHHSLISLIKSPISIDYKKLNITNKQDKRCMELYGENEFDKNFFIKLKAYAPDYLIIDNYADAVDALIYSDKGWYTDNFYIKNSDILSYITVKHLYSQHEPERLRLYKDALETIKIILKDVIQENHIILMQGRQSLVKEENNQFVEWHDAPFYKKSNVVWDELDYIFLNTFTHARRIDMRDNKYVSVSKTPLGMTQNHFQSEYYREALNKFNKIVLQDLLIEKAIRE